MSDRWLIEWTANANVGDLLPEPYRGSQAIMRRLVELGVMPEPPAEALVSELVPRAKAAAAAWLETHPD